MMNNKRYIYVFGGLLITVLQSCFVAEEYYRPDIDDFSDTLYRSHIKSNDSIQIANISWHTMFTDPYLTAYIEESLRNNFDIQIALQHIEAARAYYAQSKSEHFPSFDINAGAGYHRQFGDQSEDYTQYELIGNLSWEADIWGKIGSSKKAYKAAYLQTVAAHRLVTTEIVSSVSATYFRLLALDEQLRIIEQTIQNRINSIETTQALKTAGVLTEVAVKQTEAQLKSAEYLRLDILKEIEITENLFSILLGSGPRNIERGKLSNQQPYTRLHSGFAMELLHNRPDVLAAEYALIEAFELTNVARSQFYPSVTLTASSGLKSFDIDRLLDVNSLFATVAGGIAQPIFNRKKIRSQFEVAKARQEAAYLSFKKVLLTAGVEVSDAMFSISNTEERIRLKTAELKAYQEALNYSEELLNYGMVNYLEVLTAREQVLNAQLSLSLLQSEKWLETITLYKSLGGGWQ